MIGRSSSVLKTTGGTVPVRTVATSVPVGIVDRLGLWCGEPEGDRCPGARRREETHTDQVEELDVVAAQARG